LPYNLTSGNSTVDAICLVLAIIGGLALYFTFLAPHNEGKLPGIQGWLYDLLQFKTLIVERLLRAIYLVVAIFITLASLGRLFQGDVGGFFGLLLLGNLGTRIAFEFMLVALVVARNTSEMNKKLGPDKNDSSSTAA
jgi:hypothetical protein